MNFKENGKVCVFILLFFENYLKAIEEQNVFKTAANSILENEHLKSKLAYILQNNFISPFKYLNNCESKNECKYSTWNTFMLKPILFALLTRK